MLNKCPSCSNKENLFTFYTLKNIPIFQNVTYESYKKAANCKKGNIALTYCPRCTIVFNSLFDSSLMKYNKGYDNEQSNSECYTKYMDSLIDAYKQKWDLKNKTILEIGCGKGAFLKRICETTKSKGFGYDTTYDGNIKSANVIFKSCYFKKERNKFKADFVIIRHVLDQIDQPFIFLNSILESIDRANNPKIIIELADFYWILKNEAYWDIYYEHCNYFTKYSLKYLLENLDLKTDAIFNTFNGQNLVVIASYKGHSLKINEKQSLSEESLSNFSSNILLKKQEIINIIKDSGKEEYFAVWGAAAKGIILLNALDNKSREKIKFVIDINKKKQNRFTAVTGKLIKAPETLKKDNLIKNIIITNPNYEGEIKEMLKKMRKELNCVNLESKMDPVNRFNLERKENVKEMAKDKEFRKNVSEFMIRAAKHKFTYNFDWLGRPIIQHPEDTMALQEIIWKIKPDLIIETGIAHGGSLIFSASMLELIGGNGKVLGIDIDIRKHNRVEIEKHKMFKRITMIQGSSVADDIIRKVRKFAKGKKRVLVCLDSMHTHEHVLKELQLYSPLVKKGSYLIVFDTNVEDMPKRFFPDRPWDKGNNPKTAVWEFLKTNDRFEIDKEIENKLLITEAPDGFLKCIKE